jgi:hypothetical protein
MPASRRLLNAHIRAARSLDPQITLGCPMCVWSGNVLPYVLSWRSGPSTPDGKDHHQRASNCYLKHLETVHGVVLSGLERGHLPIVVDSPQSRSTQTVWVVNNIIGDLVGAGVIADTSTARRVMEVARVNVEKMVRNVQQANTELNTGLRHAGCRKCVSTLSECTVTWLPQ